MTPNKHIELLFPAHAHIPGDLTIIEKATYDRPGRAALGAAHVETNGRVTSANGGAFIGFIAAGPPDPPYNFAYILEETPPLPPGEGPGERAISPIGESSSDKEVHHA